MSQDAVHGVARLLSCNPLNNDKSGKSLVIKMMLMKYLRYFCRGLANEGKMDWAAS